MLKDYQKKVVGDVEEFFRSLDVARQESDKNAALQKMGYVSFAYGSNQELLRFTDRPLNGLGKVYPRVCVKMPTGGGKTLIAIETIRAYQNIFAKRKTGLVIWITHRDQIYRQTIENLQNKSHIYRQLLDQTSGNRTIIAEKGQALRKQDIEENLVVLMVMIQSAGKSEVNKMFEDSGGYTDFFPPENRYDQHRDLLNLVPNLDRVSDELFDRVQVKTSLGNLIRVQNPLCIVDELHTMWTDGRRKTLDGLNPSVLIGLSATPKKDMNIVSEVTGKALEAEEMIKLPMHLFPPSRNEDWHAMLTSIMAKRDYLENKAQKFGQNKGNYLRPIALIQVERTGNDQRGHGSVHSEDVREWLEQAGVPKHQIAVKSSSLDEIKAQKLLSRESEIRYIITKEALKEGWDCSFAYILGVIPNAHNNSSMTQLVGRILRQPYAKKTGVKDLDESYIYFSSGQTQEVMDRVVAGFADEGLKDVAPGIQAHDISGQPINPPKSVIIKKELRKKYPESLTLPVWLIKNGRGHRKFSYEMDIKPLISWDIEDRVKDWISELVPGLGQRRDSIVELIVNLEDGAKTIQTNTTSIIRFDEQYLARRLNDTVGNAFTANWIAESIMALLRKKSAPDILDRDAGYIANFIESKLVEHKGSQEKNLFADLIKADKLALVVTDDDELGFEMPDSDNIANNIPSTYRLSLYEDVDYGLMNSLEQNVAQILDGNKNVIWWARNKAQKGWYAIQGWQKDKIRPDFVAAIKNDKGDLEFVYVMESKGEHLLGNDDTQYKTDVLDQMNGAKVEKLRLKTTSIKMNDHFEFELVPGGEEDQKIRARLHR